MNRPTPSPTRLAIAVTALVATVVACQTPSARFDREVSWHDQGLWLKADTHIHTRFSDGAHPVEEVVAKAEAFGCDVVAITDHADRGLTAATPEYFAAIDAARKAHPRMIILAGLEWNVPPFGGAQHATVLVDPSAEQRLVAFKMQFDDLDRPTHDATLAEAGLAWLAANATANGVAPVVINEHPSRAAAHSLDGAANLRAWRKVNSLVIGFAGAPGHQDDTPTGTYRSVERTIDRWDPVVARVGDAWDRLLAEGLDVWAADAPSDFHNVSPADPHDYWPGEFSETWLYVPSNDPAGVLRAFHAGSFFADHGRIVRNVWLEVTAPGLSRPAGPGEAISVKSGATVHAGLRFDVPPTGWPPGPNTIDRVEIIAIDNTGARVAASGPPAASGTALTASVAVPDGGVVFRARGYRELGNGARLVFYTNPVRVSRLR